MAYIWHFWSSGLCYKKYNKLFNNYLRNLFKVKVLMYFM